MAQYIDMDNVRFLLHEVLNVEQLCTLDRHKDYDKAAFDLLLESTKTYADNMLYPVFKAADEDPARYEDGKIYVHPSVEKIIRHAGESGAIGATFDYEVGGMQLPHIIYAAMSHIAQSANNSLTGYAGLTSGAANLIVTFGTPELIERFTPKMISGDWGGTMCLTEPQAGSSLSDITTYASPNEDGSYNIKGQKIFISGGDHEYCENFVHLVLARIDGAPVGTKGISLFVVPKMRKAADGSLESNDVLTAGDFQKLGQKGYCTTHLVFGEKNDSKGWLVGPMHKGLKCMFQMMNGARIDVGFMAASIATAAYHASLQYAKERPQGRRILEGGQKNLEAEQTTIINHPDVKRMLFLQKAIAEGSVSLLLQASLLHDLSTVGPEEDREHYHDLLEILTPIAKTYPSEVGRTAVNAGLQIYGGYGFCKEFPLEQYYRDIRIMSLYEGTTGIQSLDLLGRKVTMKNGQAMRVLTKEIIKDIKAATNYDDLKPYANSLSVASKTLEQTLMHLLQFAMSGKHERFIADANIFMEMMSNIVIGWQWLRMATVAKTAMVTGKMEFGEAFYASKIHTMKFYFKYELPKIAACQATLMHAEALTLKEETESVLV